MTIGNQPVNSDVMWGNLSSENSPMKSHIQGLFILLGVAIALLALANIAAPVLGDAFGEDGAIVAESAADDGADPAVEAAMASSATAPAAPSARRSSSISSKSPPRIARCSSTPSR